MGAGACVCWFSMTHNGVVLSTTEAEYVALGDTIKDAIFIGYVWSFIFWGFGATYMTIVEENEGARHLAQNPVCTSNSKLIDVRHHFLRELIFRGSSSLLMQSRRISMQTSVQSHSAMWLFATTGIFWGMFDEFSR